MDQIHLTTEQAGSLIGAIIWFIRLEGKHSSTAELNKARLDALDEKVKSLTDKHESLERRVAEDISAMRELLAEMKSDVKSLLKQGRPA